MDVKLNSTEKGLLEMGNLMQGTVGPGGLRRYVPAQVDEEGNLSEAPGRPIYLRESRFAQWRSVIVGVIVVGGVLYLSTKTSSDYTDLLRLFKTGMDQFSQHLRDIDFVNTSELNIESSTSSSSSTSSTFPSLL